MQPGETISPGAAPTPAPGPEKQDQPAVPVEQPAQPVAPTPPPAVLATPEPATNWQFTEGSAEPQVDASSPSQDTKTASWSASEYIAHNKGTAWFALLGVGLFVFIAVVYIATKDVVASIMVGIAGVTFGVFAARSPRVLEYTVNASGIQIGQKLYTYADFKSFSLAEDGPLPAIILLPLKRFLPPITVFYEPKEEDSILDVLADYLPHEEKQPDIVDKLMRRIRF